MNVGIKIKDEDYSRLAGQYVSFRSAPVVCSVRPPRQCHRPGAWSLEGRASQGFEASLPDRAGVSHHLMATSATVDVVYNVVKSTKRCLELLVYHSRKKFISASLSWVKNLTSSLKIKEDGNNSKDRMIIVHRI